MNELWNRVYHYGTCGLGQDAVDELLKILDRLEELERLAEIGRAVEWAIENKIRFITLFPYDVINIDDIDLNKLLRMYDSQQPTN